MTRRLPSAALAALLLAVPLSPVAQNATTAQSAETPRAIRRDMPMTNTIRRAFAAGTRDTSGRPGPNYWQLQTDYTMTVRLDPETQTLTGSGSIAIHNNSPQDLRDIYLRLDHNIFRSRQPFAQPWLPGETTEGMVVTKLAVNGAPVDLAPRGVGGGSQPRLAATGLDRTVARIALAEPISGKSKATLEVAWRTKLPSGPGSGHRMVQRFEDQLFQPTQWYPRVAKYDDLRGWNTDPYLGPSEFYNNFGRFDVRIDVPAGWIVSGTGVLQNPQQVLTPQARERLARVLQSNDVVTIVGDDEVGPGQATAAGDRLVWHHVADNVNDFAWATARKFTWKATRATVPGKGPIPIHMVYQPARANLFNNAAEIARHAIEFYSKLIVPYPFPQLTLQDGPSSGMEYPMVINSNAGAADHESAHQWWPMMVGTNETWYGWMDEGFDEYMNVLSDADTRKAAPNLNRAGQEYGQFSGREEEAPMMWNANYAGPSYSFTTYSKTPLMLSMLGGIVGDAAVQRGLAKFAEVWAWKHPSPWDFAHLMNQELKQDLNWFWYSWLWTTDSVDGKIETVTTNGGRTTVVVRQDGQMASPVVLRVRFAESGPAIKPAANAKIEGNSAVVTWPVDVWFNGSRTFRADLDFGGREILSIQLDPACRFPDREPLDNVWPRNASAAATATAVPAAQRPGNCAG
jgi:hypothetical protein